MKTAGAYETKKPEEVPTFDSSAGICQLNVGAPENPISAGYPTLQPVNVTGHKDQPLAQFLHNIPRFCTTHGGRPLTERAALLSTER